jgi:hypothetical protein
MRYRPTRRLSPGLRQLLQPVPTYLTRQESRELGELVLKMKEGGTWPPGEPPPGAPRSPRRRGNRWSRT